MNHIYVTERSQSWSGDVRLRRGWFLFVLNRIKSPSLSCPFVNCCIPKKVRWRKLNCFYSVVLNSKCRLQVCYLQVNSLLLFTSHNTIACIAILNKQSNKNNKHQHKKVFIVEEQVKEHNPFQHTYKLSLLSFWISR